GELASDDARRRTGQQHRDRALRDERGRRDPAPGLHDLHRSVDPDAAELAGELADVSLDDGAYVRVERRDDGPLVLARHRVDLRGERDAERGIELCDQLAQPALVRRVAEREEERAGERLDALIRGEVADDLAGLLLVQLAHAAAVGGDALPHAAPSS